MISANDIGVFIGGEGMKSFSGKGECKALGNGLDSRSCRSSCDNMKCFFHYLHFEEKRQEKQGFKIFKNQVKKREEERRIIFMRKNGFLLLRSKKQKSADDFEKNEPENESSFWLDFAIRKKSLPFLFPKEQK